MVAVLARAATMPPRGDRVGASIRTLLLFDSEAHVIAIRDLLSLSRHETYFIEWGDPHDAGPDLLRDGGHDVCMLSCASADDDLVVLRDTEAVGRRPPVIVVTAAGDRAAESAATAAGATDCLEWGTLDADRLDRALRYAVDRNRLVVHLGHALLQVAALQRTMSQSALDRGAG